MFCYVAATDSRGSGGRASELYGQQTRTRYGWRTLHALMMFPPTAAGREQTLPYRCCCALFLVPQVVWPSLKFDPFDDDYSMDDHGTLSNTTGASTGGE